MTFLRSHLNAEGYLLYRWLRLRWSRRRRRDDIILDAKRKRLAELKQLKADALANVKPVYGYDKSANVYRVDPQRAIEVLRERHRQFDRARIEDFGRLISNTPRRK